MLFISFNGKIKKADEPVLVAANRGYRYGDGLFETMRLVNGKIQLAALHFERLFGSLNLLQYEIPKLLTAARLEEEVVLLCKKNNCEQLARVRLSFFRGDGGLYDGDRTAAYVIECWPLSATLTQFNENGLLLGVYKNAQKNCDTFSNIKSASFLPYVMAAQCARANRLNDCLVLNTDGNIADTTIANIFLIKKNEILTPALSQGCVAGVMRRHIIEKLSQQYSITETVLSLNDLRNADEVFLSNAIRGIQWVGQFGDKMYTNTFTREIYKQLIKTI